MFVFLVALGGVVATAGIGLVGVSVHDGGFDATILTPGTVALVGGLVLVGLGIAVRAVERVERAVAGRPAQPVARTEAAQATGAIERPHAQLRAPSPPKTNVDMKPPPLPAAVAPQPPAATEEPALARLREKFPTLVRIDTAPAEAENYESLPPAGPARSEPEAAELREVQPAARTSSVTPPRLAPRPEPRLEVNAPASNVIPVRAKNSVFEALWPKTQRVVQNAQPAVAPVEEPPPQVEPVPVAVEPQPEPEVSNGYHQARGPVSILKSGVVDGMAYTLYSDGSIEAQLPQGRLRFGSIAELRNHLEQSS